MKSMVVETKDGDKCTINIDHITFIDPTNKTITFYGTAMLYITAQSYGQVRRKLEEYLV